MLVASGYNTLALLQHVSDIELYEIENHVNEHREILIALDDPISKIYQQQEIVRFLPGHRALILNIPQLITNYTNGLAETCVKNIRKPESEEEFNITIRTRLQTRFDTNGFSSVLPSDFMSKILIKNFKRFENNTAECQFICPICKRPMKLSYGTFGNYWLYANLYKHFDKHYNSMQTEYSSLRSFSEHDD